MLIPVVKDSGGLFYIRVGQDGLYSERRLGDGSGLLVDVVVDPKECSTEPERSTGRVHVGDEDSAPVETMELSTLLCPEEPEAPAVRLTAWVPAAMAQEDQLPTLSENLEQAVIGLEEIGLSGYELPSQF